MGKRVCAKLGNCTVIETKLCALHRGLELAWESGWAPLEVESDSNVVVALVLNKLVHKNHRLFLLVKNCQELLERNWRCSLRCVLGKPNLVAVYLATLGLSIQFGCHQFDVPPPACAPLFVQDEYSVPPPGSVAASKMKNREADRVNQTGARLNNLRVRKLIQKALRMKNKKVKEDPVQVPAPVSEQISMEFHKISVAKTFEAVEPLGKENEGEVPSNVQPMNVPDFAERETPSFIQGPGSYHISGAKEYEVVSSTSADDLMDFRGLAKIEKVYVPLLDKACSCHSSLIECQKKTTPLWAFTALGRVLHFLKTRKNKDMTDDVCADLKRLWEELHAFNFDLDWLAPQVQRAMGMNELVKGEGRVKSLRMDVDELEIEKKRIKAKLEVASRELQKAKAVEEMDMDKSVGYGLFCRILNL